MHVRLRIRFHFVLILRWSLFVSHSARLILSAIVVILGWSYLRRIDSHIIILVEYMSDLLYIFIELFSGYQDKQDALVAILGHIFLL